jgi:hypothetical protein
MPRGAKPGERRGGRQKGVPNKATREIKELAGQYTDEALNTLVSVARASESDAARVSAAKEILDRAYGKAPQALTGEDGEGPIRHVLEVVCNGFTIARRYQPIAPAPNSPASTNAPNDGR